MSQKGTFYSEIQLKNGAPAKLTFNTVRKITKEFTSPLTDMEIGVA